MWIAIVIYFILGFICASHWFEEDYGEEYRQAKVKGEVEEGMVTLLLLIMVTFFPIIFVYKFYKAFTTP